MTSQAALPFTLTPPTPECNVEVRPSPTAGNGLFATKDIPAGSTILLTARPLIGELDLPRLQDSCHNCFMWAYKAAKGCAVHATQGNKEPGCHGCENEGGNPGVKACTGCKKVKYCSKVCFMFFMFLPVQSRRSSFSCVLRVMLMQIASHVDLPEAGLDKISQRRMQALEGPESSTSSQLCTSGTAVGMPHEERRCTRGRKGRYTPTPSSQCIDNQATPST